MMITNNQKDKIKAEIRDRLATEQEIQKIVIFGSYTKSNEPNDIEIEISDDECDFHNSIYLPSKYPMGRALADFEPDETICRDRTRSLKKH